MTQAVCFGCGEIKHGAFNRCNQSPTSGDEFVISLAMTDHYFDLDTMKQMGSGVKDGNLPILNEDNKRDLLEQIRGFRKMPLGRAMGGSSPVDAKNKKRRFWFF